MWIYRGRFGEAVTQAWCRQRLASWPLPHRRQVVRCGEQIVHLVVAGEGHRRTVVVVAGRHGNAATLTGLVEVLAQRYRVVAVDLPGEAGLGSGGRPNTHRLREYGAWLDEVLVVLAQQSGGGLTVVGHGFGAAVALAAHPQSYVSRLVLLDPCGLVRPSFDPAVTAALLAWRLCPSASTGARLLAAPGFVAPAGLVDWLRIVGRHVAMSNTPPAYPELVRDRGWHVVPCTVAVGEHDPVFGADRLARPARQILGAGVVTVPDAGFLLPYERPQAVLSLLEAAEPIVPAPRLVGSATQTSVVAAPARRQPQQPPPQRRQPRQRAAGGSGQCGQLRPARSPTRIPSGSPASRHARTVEATPATTTRRGRRYRARTRAVSTTAHTAAWAAAAAARRDRPPPAFAHRPEAGVRGERGAPAQQWRRAAP